MSEQFTEVSEQGFGSNLLDSIKGVAVGGLLFILSFPVLWWNEGRTDLSQVAKRAQIVKPDSVDKSAEGKLVSVTGELRSAEQIGDRLFLKPGAYVRLQRVVEMYAWIENKETKTQKKLGGGKRTETTYSYDMDWTEHPKASSQFRYPEGHENPSMPFESEAVAAKQAAIGAYTFRPGEAELPHGERLPLTPDMIKVPLVGGPAGQQLGAPNTDGASQDEARPDDSGDDGAEAAPAEEELRPNKKARKHHGRRPRAAGAEPARPAVRRPAPAPVGYRLVGDTYLFRGRGTMERPRVGDVRISFRALTPGARVTLFGQQQGSEVGPYTVDGNERLYRVLVGGHEQAVQTLATEHKIITWVLRLVGWLMMWFGLMMFFGPINAFLDIIPFLGSAGRFLIGLVMLPVSLLTSTAVIVLSIIAHNPILLVLTLIGLGAGGYLLYRRKRARQSAG